MVGWNGVVIDKTRQAVLRHAFGSQRNLKRAGPRAVRRWRVVVGRGIGLSKTREWLCDHRRLRHCVEKRLGTLLSVSKDLVHVGHDQFASLFGQWGAQIPPLRV